MDELIKAGQWWWLLIPLGTGVCALLGSWLGAFLGRQNEHRQWLRNEKRQAYQEYLRSGYAMAQFLNASPERLSLLTEDMHAHIKVILSPDIHFFAPSSMGAALQAFNSSVVEAFAYTPAVAARKDAEQVHLEFNKAYDVLRSAMRKELGIKL